nr:sigma-70 family RNA polymerase sigma factor [candidate division Zixibacteria bacterium]
MDKNDSNYLSSLVGRCLADDRNAWTELVERITPLVFSICRRMKLSREDSFDIYGQVSFLLWKNLDRLQTPAKLLSYVTTITRRVVYAHQKKSRILERVEEAIKLETGDLSAETPEEVYAVRERSEILLKALARLPRRDYQLIRALFFNRSNPTYEEIARQLGIPVSSIGPSRERCFKKLYRLLKKNERFFRYFL